MDKNIFLCAKRKTGRFLLISSLLIVLCISAIGIAGCGHTHTVIIDAAVAPTKTTSGLTEGSHCIGCGKILKEQQEVPATGSVGLTYINNYDGKTCTVTGIGSCTDTEIIIPETSPTGYIVTAIQYSAFKDCDGINSLLIPDSVTEIGNYAFEDCKKLTNVIIGNGVRRLGYGVFNGCVALVDISIGNSVTRIEDDAFKNCNSLKYNEYDNALYLGNDTNKFVVLMRSKSINIASCKINDNCNVIYEEAFCECFSLKEVSIGGNVKSIGRSAFERCYRLTNLIIPDNVTSIGSSAFSGCLGLINVKLGANVIAIEDAAFFDCSKIESINIPDSVTEIGQRAFAECDKLKFNEYDNGLYLGNEKNRYMFFISPKSNDIISCEISKECKFISNYAFYDCQGLTSIVIPDSVKSVGKYAFWWCKNLKRVKIGKGVESIGAYAFLGCGGLQEILYNGTQGQWRAVKKKIDWNKDTGEYTVYCIYGEWKKEQQDLGKWGK